MWAKLKALWTIKKTLDQAGTEVTVKGVTTKSFLTGEFWLTVLGNAPMIACSIRGMDSIPCLALSAVVNLVYIWKRGTLKETLAKVGLQAAKDINAEKVEKPV